uniref:Polyadenylate-binding protein 2 n=1 Tax=Populus trichocarpa TaxID=3694 RepID=A0A3N7EHW5_POPTR
MDGDDVDMAAAETNESELDDMKKRLKEMEDEAAALLEMQAKVEKEMGSVQGCNFGCFLGICNYGLMGFCYFLWVYDFFLCFFLIC